MVIAYEPGRGTAVAQGSGVVFLGAEVAGTLAEELWLASQPVIDLPAVLGIVTRGGLSDLPEFAIAVRTGAQLSVVIHGGIEVEVAADTGSVVRDGRNISTWTEFVVDHPRHVSLRSIPEADDPQEGDQRAAVWLSLSAGVVLADSVILDFLDQDEAGGAGQGSRPRPLPSDIPAISLAKPVVSESIASSAAAGAEEAFTPAEADIDDETVLASSLRRARLTSSEEAVRGASEDEVPDLTILSSELVDIRRRLPTWPDDKVPGPFPVPDGLALRVAERRDEGPSTTIPPAGSTIPPARPVAKISLSSGMIVPLDRPVLLGRAPMASRGAGAERPRLVTVESPRRDISRTHLQVAQVIDDVVVTDLHSTNGVYVTEPGAAAHLIVPGEPTVVPVGGVVDLGDGVTFQIEPLH